MRHDVTMPQLGMAQDAGRIVAWLKAAGDPVAKGDALDQIGVESQCPADGVGDVIDIDDVLHAGADVVILRVEENLGLVAESSELHGVDDPAGVAFKDRPDRAGFIRFETAA